MSADFDALRARFRQQALAEPPRKARKRREAKRVAAVDGRSLRAKGRTQQLNTRCRPDLCERLRAFTRANKVPLADVIEAALEEYMDAHEADNA